MYYRCQLNIPSNWRTKEKVEIIMSEIKSNLTSKISCAEILNESGLVVYFEYDIFSPSEYMTQIQFLGAISNILNNLLIKGYIYG